MFAANEQNNMRITLYATFALYQLITNASLFIKMKTTYMHPTPTVTGRALLALKIIFRFSQ
jgi:hypothetical protein